MLIEKLKVYHVAKAEALESKLGDFKDKAFYFESCLRRLLISCDHFGEDGHVVEATQIFEAGQAYRFLLQVAAGLESPIKGETEIFGQLKQAWRQTKTLRPDFADRLTPLMDKLFADVKHVRSEYLQGIGGTSYGSLTRKILEPKLGEQILIVGAGDLAEQVLPLFKNWPLAIWNRDKIKLTKVIEALGKTGTSSTVTAVDDESLSAMIERCAHVIICIPVDIEREKLWIEARKRRTATGGKIVHLGGLEDQVKHWADCPGFFSLSSVLTLDEGQDKLRLGRIIKAQEACAERARRRELDDSVSLLHGWEDLSFSS